MSCKHCGYDHDEVLGTLDEVTGLIRQGLHDGKTVDEAMNWARSMMVLSFARCANPDADSPEVA